MKYKTIDAYRELLEKEGLIVEENIGPILNESIKDVSYNSQFVKPHCFFICKGKEFKKDYLMDAKSKGATLYLAEKKMDVQMPYILVKDLRKAISLVSAFYFDRSWAKGLKIIGITGTKGKSTTATMVKAILDQYLGHEIGFSSGIYTFDGEHRERARKLTTPEIIELHRLLDNATNNHCGYLVMEVSSQGLKYDRVKALSYEVGAFLNISPDHISEDEHENMEDYFTSKLKLFEQSRKVCINLDIEEPYLERIMEKAKEHSGKIITFGFSQKSQVKGLFVSEKEGVLTLEAELHGKKEVFQVNIGGEYNGSNALCAIAITYELGVPIESIKEGLKNLWVEGRMEHYKVPSANVDIIVDSAHNKMSYEAIFDYVESQYPQKKKGFLFGCVGNKALNRRKEAGEIADKKADFVVITERDPGTESVEKICNEILSYMKEKEKAEIIVNRDQAVYSILEKGIEMKNSVILLCGCGSDSYVKRGNSLIPFKTDGQRVKEYLNAHSV